MSATVETTVTSEIRLLSKRDVALLLGYTTRTIDRLVQSHKIPFTSLPVGSGSRRKIKFIQCEIEAWIRGGSVVVVAGEDN